MQCYCNSLQSNVMSRMRVQQHESFLQCLFIKKGICHAFFVSFYKAKTRLRINGPFAEYGHMVQQTPCWMPNDAEGQEKQRDYIIQKAEITSFQVPTASFLCHPARCFCTM